MRRALLLFVAGVAAATAALPSEAATPPPVRVGVHFMDVKSTDGLNPTGQGEMSRAVEGVRQWVNKHGGLGGRQLEIILHPSKYPVFVVDRANEVQRVCDSFVAKRVFAAVLGQPSRDLISCLGKHGIVVLADSQATDESLFTQLRGRYFAPGGVGQRRLGRALANTAVRYKMAGPGTRIVVVHANDPELNPNAAAVVARLRQLGSGSVQNVTWATQDGANLVNTWKSAGVEFVIIVENGSTTSIQLYPVALALQFAPQYLISSNSDPAGLRSIAPPQQLELTRVLSWHQYDVQDPRQEQPPRLPSTAKVCEHAAAANGYVPLGRTESSVAGRLCDGLLLLKTAFAARNVTSWTSFANAVRAVRGYSSPASYGTDLRVRQDGATVARLLSFTTGAGCLCWGYVGPASLADGR